MTNREELEKQVVELEKEMLQNGTLDEFFHPYLYDDETLQRFLKENGVEKVPD